MCNSQRGFPKPSWAGKEHQDCSAWKVHNKLSEQEGFGAANSTLIGFHKRLGKASEEHGLHDQDH